MQLDKAGVMSGVKLPSSCLLEPYLAPGHAQHSRFSLQNKGRERQAAGSRQQAAGSRQQAAGSRQQAAGSRQQAAGSRQQAAGRWVGAQDVARVCHRYGEAIYATAVPQLPGSMPDHKSYVTNMICRYLGSCLLWVLST
jgi:hypothetical protein